MNAPRKSLVSCGCVPLHGSRSPDLVTFCLSPLLNSGIDLVKQMCVKWMIQELLKITWPNKTLFLFSSYSTGTQFCRAPVGDIIPHYSESFRAACCSGAAAFFFLLWFISSWGLKFTITTLVCSSSSPHTLAEYLINYGDFSLKHWNWKVSINNVILTMRLTTDWQTACHGSIIWTNIIFLCLLGSICTSDPWSLGLRVSSWSNCGRNPERVQVEALLSLKSNSLLVLKGRCLNLWLLS